MYQQVKRNQVEGIVGEAVSGIVDKVRLPANGQTPMASREQQLQIWEKYRLASPEQRIAFVANANRGLPQERIVQEVDKYESEMTRRFG